MTILILSASVGAGHLRAAQAVELAARELVPEAHIENIDVLSLTNAAFRRVYAHAYLDLVNHAPHLLGYFYDLMDQPSKSGRNRGDKLRMVVERLNAIRFTRLIRERKPDLIINTHFLPASIIAHRRREGDWDIPQVTVTTDFETHRLWVNDPCEHYFTAVEEGALGLVSWGVNRERISVTGIPIHPVFSQEKDRGRLLRKHGLSDKLPVVLQLAGGFGVGPIGRIFTALLSVSVPMQLVVVTGKNASAREQLAQMDVPARHRAQVLGYTQDMDELLALADVVVSKPGGLTTSETLARGAAMVILDPIPGQETRNSDFLLENGAAVKVNSLPGLPHKVTMLLEDSARLSALQSSARKLGRPRAAFDIVEQTLRLA